MKKSLLSFLMQVLLLISMNGQNLKPYILFSESNGTMQEVISSVQDALKSNDIRILGNYHPVGAADRYVFIVTNDNLINAVKTTGGLTGFASAMRVAVTKENNSILISYTDPAYWGNAYFRDEYSKVKNNLTAFKNDLETALSPVGVPVIKPFGSEEGITPEKLRNYRYMFGMPRFDDTEIIHSFSSYEEAVRQVDENLNAGVTGVKKIYEISIPGKYLKLYGIALTGDDGESHFMPRIDIDNPKHTAFLPYEFLIMGNEVHMLHGRFRIALSFPDLTMGTFTKIMSTPGDIEDAVSRTVMRK